MPGSPLSPVAWLLRYARRLRHPYLFLLVTALFGLDLVVPDVIPLLDELLLGLMTVLLGTWRDRARREKPLYKPPEKDVTPRDGGDPEG